MVSLAVLSSASHAAIDSISRVAVFETPAQGIQPQAVVDAKGAIHLVYFKGEAGGGDIYYARLSVRNGRIEREGAAVRVNSIVGSALATGTVRGAQIALGRNGFVHVAWHGSKPVEGSGSPHPPVWYAPSITGTRFEPQQLVSGSVSGIDVVDVFRGSQHDHRQFAQVRLLPNPLQHFKTIFARHFQIEQQ